MVFSRLLRGARRLIGRQDAGGAPRPLRVTPELGLLTHVLDVGAYTRADLPAPGVVAARVASRHIDEDIMKARLAGRTAGVGMPDWHDGSGGAPMAGVHVCRIPDALYAPDFGAVITRDGDTLHTTVAEALFLTPTLAALPWVKVENEKVVMHVPEHLPRIDAAAIFVAWGGRFNYGHFLLDCLPALQALMEAGLLDHREILAPPLNAWQKELVALTIGVNASKRIRSITQPLVQVDDLVFASPMDHFLHAPNTPLEGVRAAVLANLPQTAAGPRLIYVSRRGDQKRRLVNEEALEQALKALGFTIVQTGEMSVARQAALFRDADVIVAPTGAALANALFCKPGAKVFELQPSNFVGIWVRGVCHLVGAEWHGFFVQSPLEETKVQLEGEDKPGLIFAWRIPIEPFMDFLRARM